MTATHASGISARTLAGGVVEVTFGEPLSGTVEASEWTVGGVAAVGVADTAGDPFEGSLDIESATAFVLAHATQEATGATPSVAYSPSATS